MRSSFSAGRSLPICSWPTRSTGPRPRPSRPCSRPCRSGRSPSRGTTHQLVPPFFVLATQNPLEMEGTYPLPEAQLDRFFFKLLVKYPTAQELETILDRTTEADEPGVSPVFDGQRIVALSRLARQIPIALDLKRYAVALILATHPDDPRASTMAKRFVRYGSSPRGAQAMILGAKIRAILDHRYHVAREDLRAAPGRPCGTA